MQQRGGEEGPPQESDERIWPRDLTLTEGDGVGDSHGDRHAEKSRGNRAERQYAVLEESRDDPLFGAADSPAVDLGTHAPRLKPPSDELERREALEGRPESEGEPKRADAKRGHEPTLVGSSGRRQREPGIGAGVASPISGSGLGAQPDAR